MKTCSKCKQEKSLEEYSKRAAEKDGLSPYCKECMKGYYKRARTKTPRECLWCQTEIEEGQKYRWTDRNGKTYYHRECWMKYEAFLEKTLEEFFTPAPVEKVDTCKHGHIRTEENTYTYTGKQGWVHRICKDCQKDKKRRAKAQRLGSVYY